MPDKKSLSNQIGVKKRRLNKKTEDKPDFTANQKRSKNEYPKAMSKFSALKFRKKTNLIINTNRIAVKKNCEKIKLLVFLKQN